jgi:hypothetical protein
MEMLSGFMVNSEASPWFQSRAHLIGVVAVDGARVLTGGSATLFSDTVEGPGGRGGGDVGVEFGGIPGAGCSDRDAGSVAALSDEVRYACGSLGDLDRGTYSWRQLNWSAGTRQNGGFARLSRVPVLHQAPGSVRITPDEREHQCSREELREWGR